MINYTITIDIKTTTNTNINLYSMLTHINRYPWVSYDIIRYLCSYLYNRYPFYLNVDTHMKKIILYLNVKANSLIDEFTSK